MWFWLKKSKAPAGEEVLLKKNNSLRGYCFISVRGPKNYLAWFLLGILFKSAVA